MVKRKRSKSPSNPLNQGKYVAYLRYTYDETVEQYNGDGVIDGYMERMRTNNFEGVYVERGESGPCHFEEIRADFDFNDAKDVFVVVALYKKGDPFELIKGAFAVVGTYMTASKARETEQKIWKKDGFGENVSLPWVGSFGKELIISNILWRPVIN